MRPEFHPAAAEELASVAVAYERHAEGLGGDFRAEVQRVATLLCDTPTIGEPLDSIHRRFPLTRFPFALIYRADPDALRIIAVAHRRRRPGYWHGRTFS